MGNIAEGVFAELYPAHHRSGLDKPPMTLKEMSNFNRNAPDFLVRDRYVEVIGCGSDQTIKVRISKIVALIQWSVHNQVDIFVYDSKNKRYCQGPVDAWVDLFFQHGEYGVFSDGPTMVGLKCSKVPFEWGSHASQP